MKKKNTFYYWATDTRNNSGEGVLANKFIFDIKKYYKDSNLININKNKKNYHTFFSKYFLNFFGAFQLWKYYCLGHKTIYVNYLPIWNFLIFIILPPKTILGPITGSPFYNKRSLLDFFLRGFLINIFKNISLYVIFLRKKKILFSTELLKSSIKKNKIKRCYFNYVLQLFPGFSKNEKKKIDFLIYHRLHNNKNNSMIYQFIKSTLKIKYKIVVIGDKINSENVKNMGYISRAAVKKLLANTKCTFGSSENLYTLFALDAISENVLIFYDYNLKSFNTRIKYRKMIPIDFNNPEKSLNLIFHNLNNKKILSKKNYFKKINFDKYFNKCI